jgi:protein translocase SecG subunit
LIYILYTLFFTSCAALILSVLLQPGKTDAGALFTSNISSGALGPRGTQTILSKITIVAATVFMLSALFIAMPALQGGNSVLNANPDSPVTQPPITDLNANTANTNAAVDANANTVTNANTNIAVPANTSANVTANANKSASANANK